MNLLDHCCLLISRRHQLIDIYPPASHCTHVQHQLLLLERVLSSIAQQTTAPNPSNAPSHPRPIPRNVVIVVDWCVFFVYTAADDQQLQDLPRWPQRRRTSLLATSSALRWRHQQRRLRWHRPCDVSLPIAHPQSSHPSSSILAFESIRYVDASSNGRTLPSVD